MNGENSILKHNIFSTDFYVRCYKKQAEKQYCNLLSCSAVVLGVLA